MSTSTDYRKYVRQQGKAAFDEARKPLLAWVGATDLARDRVLSQLRELPGETQARVRRLQGGVESFDPVQLTAQVRKAVRGYAKQARKTYVDYRVQAQEQYSTLSHRGELVVRRLRRRPELRSAFGRTERLLRRTEKLVEEAEEQVTGKPASVGGTRSSGSSGSSSSARSRGSSTSAAGRAPAGKAQARTSTSTRS
jgi:hypothetical protein